MVDAQEALVTFQDLRVGYGRALALAGVSGAFPAGATGLLAPMARARQRCSRR